MQLNEDDVVRVVRCRYCKYFKPYQKPVEDFDGLCKWHVGICGEVDEDFYCQFGERKDGD